MRLKNIRSKVQIIYDTYLIKIEKGWLLKNNYIFKKYLQLVKGFKINPCHPVNIPWNNTTLKNEKDVALAVKIIKNSRLNLHPGVLEKNWDSLIALKTILQNTNVSSRILDAGGERNSLVLLWLYHLGYYNLKCLNLTFKKRMKRGNIDFIPGDLTKTPFPRNYFDVITCISVIEHGVGVKKYLKEMNRILKKGGLLITSTDYWESKIDTNNKVAFNNPVFVHDKESIMNLLKIADNNGLKLYGPDIDFKCQDKVVHWKKFNFDFTFLIFCLQKK